MKSETRIHSANCKPSTSLSPLRENRPTRALEYVFQNMDLQWCEWTHVSSLPLRTSSAQLQVNMERARETGVERLRGAYGMTSESFHILVFVYTLYSIVSYLLFYFLLVLSFGHVHVDLGNWLTEAILPNCGYLTSQWSGLSGLVLGAPGNRNWVSLAKMAYPNLCAA